MKAWCTFEDGRELYRWTNPTGDEWACMVYDHGPFCRLCQPVDGTLGACLDAVALGQFDAEQDADGEFSFRLTQKGQAAVESSLSTNPEMVELWAKLQGLS